MNYEEAVQALKDATCRDAIAAGEAMEARKALKVAAVAAARAGVSKLEVARIAHINRNSVFNWIAEAARNAETAEPAEKAKEDDPIVIEGTEECGRMIESATVALGLAKVPVTLESFVAATLGEFVEDFNVGGIVWEIRSRINRVLPYGYGLSGDALMIGPHTPGLTESQRQAAVDAWPEGDEFMAICRRHERR